MTLRRYYGEPKLARITDPSSKSGVIANIKWRYNALKIAMNNVHNYIVSERTERTRLNTLVRLWKQMKESDHEKRLVLVNRYGLSIAELDTAIRTYILRVKAAKEINQDLRSKIIGELLKQGKGQV